MTYTPQRGTIPFRAIEHLKTLAPGLVISTAELLEALGCEDSAISAYMVPAVKAGAVRVSKQPCHGRMNFWSIGTGIPLPPGRDEEEEGEERTEASGTSTVVRIDSKWPFPIPASNADSALEPEPEPAPPNPPRPRSMIPAEPAQQAGVMRCALWSDGTLQVERPDKPMVEFNLDETRELVRYLERMVEGSEA